MLRPWSFLSIKSWLFSIVKCDIPINSQFKVLLFCALQNICSLKSEKHFWFSILARVEHLQCFIWKDDTLMIPHFVRRDKKLSLKSSLWATDGGLMSRLVYDIKKIFQLYNYFSGFQTFDPNWRAAIWFLIILRFSMLMRWT